MDNESLNSERVFSYKNYILVYGYSPVWTYEALQKLKMADGASAIKNKQSFGPIKQYIINTSFGCNIYPKITTRLRNGEDLELEKIFSNKKLQDEFVICRNTDIFSWPYEFHTIAYLQDDDSPGFALVSHAGSNNPGKFIKQSELYRINESENKRFVQYLKEKNLLCPIGKTTYELERWVYTFPYDIVEHYITENYGINVCLQEKEKNEIDNDYLVNAISFNSNNSQYLNDKMRELAIKYRNHCIKLMETLCSDIELKVFTERDSLKEKYKELKTRLLAFQSTYDKTEITDDNWLEFESNINTIIDELISISKSNKQIRQEVKAELESKYSRLEPDAFEFLLQAETLYRIHKNDTEFDFAPIIVEYAKVLENQLAYLISKYDLYVERPSLGSYIHKILYKPQFAKIKYKLYDLIIIRNNSAHSHMCTIHDTEKIRSYYYNDKLLELLSPK